MALNGQEGPGGATREEDERERQEERGGLKIYNKTRTGEHDARQGRVLWGGGVEVKVEVKERASKEGAFTLQAKAHGTHLPFILFIYYFLILI